MFKNAKLVIQVANYELLKPFADNIVETGLNFEVDLQEEIERVMGI